MPKRTGLADEVRRILRVAEAPLTKNEVHRGLRIGANESAVSATLCNLVRSGEVRRVQDDGLKARYVATNPAAETTRPNSKGARSERKGSRQPPPSVARRGNPKYVMYTDGSIDIHRPERVVELAAGEVKDLARFLRFADA